MTSAERTARVEKLPQARKKDLDAAMLAALKQTNDFVLSQGKPLDPMSKAAYEDIQNFLKDYQSKLTGLETAALKLTESSSKNVWNDYQVTTTDSSVAVASASYRLKGDTDITLNVQSLAQTQQNASASHHAQEQVDPGADMEFEITGPEGSTISVAVGSVNENGTAKTYHQMYQEAAGTINAQSGAGVRASVSNVDGRVSLVLTSAREGEAGGFTVSGATGAASGIEDAAVRAQDAVYTVTGNGSARTLRSDSNKSVWITKD